MSLFEPTIFRENDIRGIYPQDFNKKVAYQIGRVFVEFLLSKIRDSKSKIRVLVGRDMRLSSPEIFSGLSQGLIEQGASVFDAGLVPTDFIYSMTARLNYQAGLMITASHNPKEYNGLKMIIWQGGPAIKIINGKTIGDLINRKIQSVESRGEMKKVGHWQEYLKHIFSFVDLKKIKPLKIIVDAGNGMAGKVIPLMVKKISCQITPLFFELDGNFPNHLPNPLTPGVLEDLGKAVVRAGADFGVVFDGDADRIFLVDEQGEAVFSDQLILLLAKKILAKNPGGGIVYTLNFSRAVPEFIKKMGGQPIRSRVGYRFISQAMKENNGLMGGELACHFSFRDNFYIDSGFIAFLILLEIISEENKPLAKLVKDYKIYFKSPEINVKTKGIFKKLDLVKEKYRDGKIDELDGLTVDYQDWWFNLRLSNTEPVARLTIEAKTPEMLEIKKRELMRLIK